MTDNQLMTLLIATISAGLAAQSLSVPILQEYQPTTQGTPSTDTVYIFKLSETRYGFPGRKNIFADSVMTHSETERMEVTYQINALAIQNPANTTQTTAADYVRAVGRALQSDAAIQALLAEGVGIYRIQAMRQPYFKDDEGQFEATPSFDFTVAYNDVISSIVPSTDATTETVTGFS
jgi:hypothetical protein